MSRLRHSLLIGLPLMVVALLLPRKAHAKKPADPIASTKTSSVPLLSGEQRLQLVVDRVRDELGIPDAVATAIVPENRLVVSVERAKDRALGFRLRVEESFISQLTDAELEAVIAHELGHVWIFTHHPYLQTEELANSVALRLVDRKTLEGVYDKVWARVGERGTLTYLPND